jgi:hypothetical protein
MMLPDLLEPYQGGMEANLLKGGLTPIPYFDPDGYSHRKNLEKTEKMIEKNMDWPYFPIRINCKWIDILLSSDYPLPIISPSSR